MITPTWNARSTLCQTQHYNWQGTLLLQTGLIPSLSPRAREERGPKVSGSASIPLCYRKLWLQKDMNRVFTYLCLHFQISCAESDKFISSSRLPHRKQFQHRLWKFKTFSAILKSATEKNALQRYPGFVDFYRVFNPTTAEKMNPFYKLLKAETPINITSHVGESLDSSKRKLAVMHVN